MTWWPSQNKALRKGAAMLHELPEFLDGAGQSCYIPRFAGEVAEWLMAADCKSALLRVRWFESSPLHQRRMDFAERLNDRSRGESEGSDCAAAQCDLNG
jgi:hypothetical protein